MAAVCNIGDKLTGYREAGQGEALVLLHGIGGCADSWKHQFETLSRSYRVIAWDAPGYGSSASLDVIRPIARDYAA
ncbi:alpha/beta fold hydrolase, partial [Acinetobacter baumannii]